MNPDHTPPIPPHILVVDDDPGLCQLLAEYLSGNGFKVTAVAEGNAMRQALQQRPDALVLDLMLPGEDGLSLARWVRHCPELAELPILMLSARGEEIDRIIGLEVGADDYLAKPFNPRELLARLRALLRRSRPSSPEIAESPSQPGFGPFLLDLQAHRLLRDGLEIALTSAEFDLLRLFIERPNRVLSRDALIDALKGFERNPFDRSIDIRVTRLRRKIEPDPATPTYIRTIRGEGYLFNPHGDSL
ncbi:MAG: response regulator [Gammaproteobacteria bacterium]|nr:response regulator [Gammaproteobacteria bacterium]